MSRLEETSPTRETKHAKEGVSLSKDVGCEESLALSLAIAQQKESLARTIPKVSAEEWQALDIKVFRHYVDDLLVQRGVEDGLDALYQSGALDVFLPEVAAMVGFGDNEWRHKDVWKHTKQVVKQSVPRLRVRWGALLHDIGKPKTRKFSKSGKVTFHGHAEVGAAMFRKRTGKRLAFDKDLFDRVHFLILYHLRPAQFDDSWTDSAIRRFYKQMGDGLQDLLDLGRADITTKRPEKRRRGVKQIALLKKKIEELRAQDEKERPLPKGLGIPLSKRFNVPPSKKLGDLMKKLEAHAEAGRVAAHAPFDVYLDYVAENAEEFGV